MHPCQHQYHMNCRLAKSEIVNKIMGKLPFIEILHPNLQQYDSSTHFNTCTYTWLNNVEWSFKSRETLRLQGHRCISGCHFSQPELTKCADRLLDTWYLEPDTQSTAPECLFLRCHQLLNALIHPNEKSTTPLRSPACRQTSHNWKICVLISGLVCQQRTYALGYAFRKHW